ncbi:hypothetical protein JL722_10869 [Aureococcus anophagefferens]|nr:hypothetical protein JL722_10869 [Aureococcus anophagefferens]
MAGKIRLLLWLGAARCTALVTPSNRAAMPRRGVALTGWLDAFLPAPMTDEEFEEDRRSRWPEQYAAVLDEWAEPLASDGALLGVYYEGEGALWGAGQTTALAELKVFAGVYAPGEEYPYAGAVMDMTSG